MSDVSETAWDGLTSLLRDAFEGKLDKSKLESVRAVIGVAKEAGELARIMAGVDTERSLAELNTAKAFALIGKDSPLLLPEGDEG